MAVLHSRYSVLCHRRLTIFYNSIELSVVMALLKQKEKIKCSRSKSGCFEKAKVVVLRGRLDLDNKPKKGL